MKKIKVSNKFAIVDNEDFELLNKFSWKLSLGYARRDNQRYKISLMHMLLLGKKTGYEIDHINGNKLDNRKINLRFCKHTDNVKNMKAHKDNKSGFKGVYKHTQGKWCALIMHSGKRKYLGLFESVVDAAKAYDTAAIRYHGQYAKTNFRKE